VRGSAGMADEGRVSSKSGENDGSQVHTLEKGGEIYAAVRADLRTKGLWHWGGGHWARYCGKGRAAGVRGTRRKKNLSMGGKKECVRRKKGEGVQPKPVHSMYNKGFGPEVGRISPCPAASQLSTAA